VRVPFDVASEHTQSPQAWMSARAREVDGSGRFRFDTLPSGELELYAAIDELWLPQAVVSVGLREAQTSSVLVDLSAHRPAQFSVFVPGAPEGYGVEPWTRSASGSAYRVPVAGDTSLGRSGSSRELRALPGTCTVVLARGLVGVEPRPVRKLALGSVRFDAGASYALACELPLRKLVLRLRTAEGAPLPAGTEVVLREGEAEELLRCEIRGELRLDPGPALPFSVIVNEQCYPREGWLTPPTRAQPSELVIELRR
jgi:hypothetical protein